MDASTSDSVFPAQTPFSAIFSAARVCEHALFMHSISFFSFTCLTRSSSVLMSTNLMPFIFDLSLRMDAMLTEA